MKSDCRRRVIDYRISRKFIGLPRNEATFPALYRGKHRKIAAAFALAICRISRYEGDRFLICHPSLYLVPVASNIPPARWIDLIYQHETAHPEISVGKLEMKARVGSGYFSFNQLISTTSVKRDCNFRDERQSRGFLVRGFFAYRNCCKNLQRAFGKSRDLIFFR